jgi:simple sugar transport system permease protein
MSQTEQSVQTDNDTSRLQNFIPTDPYILRLLGIVIALFAIFAIWETDTFLSIDNFRSMGFQASEIGILALAVSLTMLTAGIDLSIVSTANLTGILVGLTLNSMAPAGAPPEQVALSVVAGLGVGLLTGLLAGLFNGILVAIVGIPAILATLGTWILYEGIGTAITGGSSVFGTTAWQGLGSNVAGIPVPVIILLVIVFALGILLTRTKFGYEIYMLGTNPTAARFSGINNNSVLIRTYVLSGVLSAIAGMIILARINSANVNFGESYVLQAVLLAVLGGIDPYGGSGRLIGVLLGLIGLQFLSTGLNMSLREIGNANLFKDFAWGGVLLLVLVINYYINQRE